MAADTLLRLSTKHVKALFQALTDATEKEIGPVDPPEDAWEITDPWERAEIYSEIYGELQIAEAEKS